MKTINDHDDLRYRETEHQSTGFSALGDKQTVNAKHTPGHWRLDSRNGQLTISGGGKWIATIHRDSGNTAAQIHPSQTEQEANADILVQAPTLLRQRDELLVVLERIAKWHGEFPPSGRTWQDGSEMSYSAAFGSNGERDFMRELARAALANCEKENQP